MVIRKSEQSVTNGSLSGPINNFCLAFNGANNLMIAETSVSKKPTKHRKAETPNLLMILSRAKSFKLLFFVLADRRGCGLSVGGTMVEFVSRGRTRSCWLCWGGSARVFRRFVGLFAGSVGVSVVVIGIGGVVRLAYSEVLVSVVSLSRGNLCVWFGRGWSSRCRFGV